MTSLEKEARKHLSRTQLAPWQHQVNRRAEGAEDKIITPTRSRHGDLNTNRAKTSAQTREAAERRQAPCGPSLWRWGVACARLGPGASASNSGEDAAGQRRSPSRIRVSSKEVAGAVGRRRKARRRARRQSPAGAARRRRAPWTHPRTSRIGHRNRPIEAALSAQPSPRLPAVARPPRSHLFQDHLRRRKCLVLALVQSRPTRRADSLHETGAPRDRLREADRWGGPTPRPEQASRKPRKGQPRRGKRAAEKETPTTSQPETTGTHPGRRVPPRSCGSGRSALSTRATAVARARYFRRRPPARLRVVPQPEAQTLAGRRAGTSATPTALLLADRRDRLGRSRGSPSPAARGVSSPREPGACFHPIAGANPEERQAPRRSGLRWKQVMMDDERRNCPRSSEGGAGGGRGHGLRHRAREGTGRRRGSGLQDRDPGRARTIRIVPFVDLWNRRPRRRSSFALPAQDLVGVAAGKGRVLPVSIS